MSGYGASRDLEYASRLESAIQQFASDYGANPSVERRTVFLFPGGLASQLMRGNVPHPTSPSFYEKSWLDCGFLFGDGLDLRMLADGVDFEQKYIVPDGGVDFFNVRPYANFAKWCKSNWIDLFVLGWDWRRACQEGADFFLNVFLPKFDARCAGLIPHPLDNFTLIGHSAGGMVVKMILNDSANQYVQRLNKAITVATPFYGYGGQVHRYFKGDPDLNQTMPANGASTYARVIASLPGPYEYLCLDYDTYDSNSALFDQDPDGPLDAYPSLDKSNPSEIADPYNPQPDGAGLVRYPTGNGFNSSYLYKAKVESRKVSRPLADSNIAAKLFNIRGIQSQSKNGTRLNNTVVSQKWTRVPETYDPDTDPDPIDDSTGHGDGTQPAWTTRLLGLPNPAQQVITIVDQLEHQNMMSHNTVQTEIATLLGLDPNAMRFFPDALEELMASRSELNTFLAGLHKAIAAKELSEERRKTILVQYLREFKPSDLHRLLTRAYIDALKSPSQKITPASSSPKLSKDRGGKKSRKNSNGF